MNSQGVSKNNRLYNGMQRKYRALLKPLSFSVIL